MLSQSQRYAVLKNPALYHTVAHVLTPEELRQVFRSNPLVLAVVPADNIDPVFRGAIFREDCQPV